MIANYWSRIGLQIALLLGLCICVKDALAGRRDSRSVELQRIAESTNLFTEDLYHVSKKVRVGRETEKGEEVVELIDRNVVLSPLSIQVALAMLRPGASGQTEQEITKGLRISKDMDESQVNAGFKDLISSLKESSLEDEGVRLLFGNRIFLGPIYPVKRPYLEIIRSHFFADAEQVDFRRMTMAAETVNKWARNATLNKIQEVIVPSMLNAQTVMLLVSAIHFKGTWKFPFNPEATSKHRFATLTGQNITVNMMQLDKARRFKYGQFPELKVSAVALPYSTQRYSLVVLLPDEGVKLTDVEEKLTNGVLAGIPTRLRSRLVDVKMPKFSLESNVDLVGSQALKTLGMERMTTEFAELTRISEEPGLRITEVVHKAFLDVNEAGSEASAVTVIAAEARSLDLDGIQFVVDRPFLAFIYDARTKSILFVVRKIT